MIMFGREGFGTHYRPSERSIEYVRLGDSADDFRIVVMDTGTVRPGLEKSTYKVRRQQCEEFVEKAQEAGFDISCLADVGRGDLYEKLTEKFSNDHGHLVKLMDYIYHSQKRFYGMMEAWKQGDIEQVGGYFRKDGLGLRDDYCISGKELETMCDIVRTVEGVYGERMLGGGDKGAAGCIVNANSVEQVKKAVERGYPRSHPELKDKYAVHSCQIVDGIKVFEDVL
jgi:galactokinase